jgi:hypothetical protein
MTLKANCWRFQGDRLDLSENNVRRFSTSIWSIILSTTARRTKSYSPGTIVLIQKWSQDEGISPHIRRLVDSNSSRILYRDNHANASFAQTKKQIINSIRRITRIKAAAENINCNLQWLLYTKIIVTVNLKIALLFHPILDWSAVVFLSQTVPKNESAQYICKLISHHFRWNSWHRGQFWGKSKKFNWFFLSEQFTIEKQKGIFEKWRVRVRYPPSEQKICSIHLIGKNVLTMDNAFYCLCIHLGFSCRAMKYRTARF